MRGYVKSDGGVNGSPSRQPSEASFFPPTSTCSRWQSIVSILTAATLLTVVLVQGIVIVPGLSSLSEETRRREKEATATREKDALREKNLDTSRKEVNKRLADSLLLERKLGETLERNLRLAEELQDKLKEGK